MTCWKSDGKACARAAYAALFSVTIVAIPLVAPVFRLGVLRQVSVQRSEVRLAANQSRVGRDAAPPNSTNTDWLDTSRKPVWIEPLIGDWVAASEFDDDLGVNLDELRDKFWTSVNRRRRAAHVLHLLRIGPPGALRTDETRTGQMLRLFTDTDAGSAFFGTPTLIKTRAGVCSSVILDGFGPAASAQEAHTDQLLCALSDMRLPLDHAITVNRHRYTIADIVRDSIANFSVQQPEIQWSILAYARYFPQHIQWSNKFGISSSFEQAIELMLATPFQSSCAGTHTLQTLTHLLRINDSECQLFGQPTRRRIVGHLQDCVARITLTQAEDGAWPANWYKGPVTVPEASDDNPVPGKGLDLKPAYPEAVSG